MSHVADVVESIDWGLLRKQKAYVLNESNNNSENEAIYGGLLNLLDALQDAAVSDGFASDGDVFGEGEE